MIEVQIDDLNGTKIKSLLAEHMSRMVDHSPPESRHVLDVKALQHDSITFWSMWSGDELMGCVALKHWNALLGEIKSMKTAPEFLRQGVGKQLLDHVIKEARIRGYEQLKLETGSMEYFEAARNLYLSHGFEYCEPFGDYVSDPNNVFMNFEL